MAIEEAYIHCAKHIPRLAKLPGDRAWGTDDVRRKGGDFFRAAADRATVRIPAPRVPADEPARPRHGGVERLLLGAAALEVVEELLVAERAARREPLPQPLGLENAHLLDEP